VSRWPQKSLGEVAVIERDSIQPGEIKTGTSYLGLEHIESGGKILSVPEVSKGDLASSKFHFTSKHILYGKLRPYLAKIACPDFGGICSTDILPILPNDNMDKRYICYFLRQPDIVALANSKSSGANLPRLSPTALSEILLPVPPLSEQKRIAEILDRAEALRAKRRAALALLDELTQSIFLDMFGDPVSNPKGWQSGKLSDVLELITYGLTVRPKYIPSGIPLISGKEIRSGTIDYENAANISHHDFEVLSQKAKPNRHDLLFSKTGSIGHTAIVEKNVPFALAQNVARLTFAPTQVHHTYALFYLRSSSIQALAKCSVRGNAVKDLQLGVMGEFPFVLPPLKLQHEFAQRIDILQRLRDVSERASLNGEQLFAALQHRAFRGEL
jgi:type I restriction enzyme S subunit